MSFLSIVFGLLRLLWDEISPRRAKRPHPDDDIYMFDEFR